MRNFDSKETHSYSLKTLYVKDKYVLKLKINIHKNLSEINYFFNK